MNKRVFPLAGLTGSFPHANKSITQFCTLVLALLLASAATVAARTDSDRKGEKPQQETTTDGCEVKNFGKVNENFYRGGQPEEEQFRQLAALGVKTIIDLRDDAKDKFRREAEAAGLRYINLPLDDKSYPAADAAKRFLELANNQANWPIFVHCAGGRHRTGAMTAVYRMTVDGWDLERAYEEMKQYDFYTRWGHKPIKTFVFDYWRELQQSKVRPVAEPVLSTPVSNP
jgi:protein tyrosine phosphatase (PTP) superfamily phosphohydrolase (DUF442 family)